MATIKSYTDLSQSRKLAEFLPIKSADMRYTPFGDTHPWVWNEEVKLLEKGSVPCWSLAALLEYMNRNFYNISLNYCGSEYTISFDDGERYKTISKDYSIDAAFEMIVWLKENGKI